MKILHKANALKGTIVLLAVLLMGWSILIFLNSAQLASRETQQQAQSVFNHTQTLNEIQSAVNELKSNNQADHAQTIKYINCVLVGITNTPNQTQALEVYQTCLADSGAN